MREQKPQKKFETPYNLQAEAQVIGSIVIDGSNAMKKISHIITAKDFFSEGYRAIYKAADDIYKSNVEPDVTTIGDHLKNSGCLDLVGGYAALMTLTDDVTTSSRVVYYARIIAKYSTARRILSAARDIAQLTQDVSSVDELVTKAESRLKGVTQAAVQAEGRYEIVDLQPLMTAAREHREPEGVIKGISTGLQKIDKMTQGFVPGELMIISGSTSHGKTQLSNNIMLNVVKNNHKVMFITMEMTKQETADRFNMLTRDQDIGEGKIFLNMRSDLAYVDVVKLIEKAKERGVDLVVIDHLHYFSRSVDNASQEIGKIVKEFKQAAVVYELPIILICHVTKLDPKIHPTINDLRDSSLIAQDADIVLIVWSDQRPNATNPNEVEVTLWKNRSRQKKHRRDYVYSDNFLLVEEDPTPPSVRERNRYVASTARITGDKDLADVDLEDFFNDTQKSDIDTLDW